MNGIVSCIPFWLLLGLNWGGYNPGIFKVTLFRVALEILGQKSSYGCWLWMDTEVSLAIPSMERNCYTNLWTACICRMFGKNRLISIRCIFSILYIFRYCFESCRWKRLEGTQHGWIWNARAHAGDAVSMYILCIEVSSDRNRISVIIRLYIYIFISNISSAEAAFSQVEKASVLIVIGQMEHPSVFGERTRGWFGWIQLGVASVVFVLL